MNMKETTPVELAPQDNTMLVSVAIENMPSESWEAFEGIHKFVIDWRQKIEEQKKQG